MKFIGELQRIRGLSGKEFFQGLEEECSNPELKLNSRDIAKGELEGKMEKFKLISEVSFLKNLVFYSLNKNVYRKYKTLRKNMKPVNFQSKT